MLLPTSPLESTTSQAHLLSSLPTPTVAMLAFPISFDSSSGNEVWMAVSTIFTSPSLWDKTRALQHVGETVFVASILISFLQAFIALMQYRNNPAGELIAPPGPTIGVEVPRDKKSSPNGSEVQSVKKGDKLIAGLEQKWVEAEKLDDEESAIDSPYARMLSRFNRYMVLILPFISSQLGLLFQSQLHLLHIGFIFTLARIFDVPASFIERKKKQYGGGQESNTNGASSQHSKPLKKDRLDNIVVIGDSLAVGLGTLNVFDKNKNSSIDFSLIENLSAPPYLESPAFPRGLAAQLAELQQLPVHWRSAGVDGGTVLHIKEFCLDVLREEVKAGRSPDCVVVLCGINDLKQILSNPLSLSSPSKIFRTNLSELLVNIRKVCPESRVILPALPAQMIHVNSPVNIFPLSIFLDTIMAFWESQKKLVADSFPEGEVLYLPISGAELQTWYDDDDRRFRHTSDDDDGSLLSADGVHPNARCYSKWGSSVATHLHTKLVQEQPVPQQQQQQVQQLPFNP